MTGLERTHLRRRAGEEAEAALAAVSVAATIAHVRLATGYLRRIADARNGEPCP